MGWYVHLHVCFAAESEEQLQALASRCLGCLPETACKEARWFLESMRDKPYLGRGPKGHLAMWGMIGNHTNAKDFVEDLRGFWLALFASDDDPLDFEKILVFFEPEQAEAASAIQIGFEDGLLVIKEYDKLPFTWGQF